jgi:hypothetical protein
MNNSPASRIILQLGGVWLAGALLPPVMLGFLVGAILGGTGVRLVLLLVLAGAVVALTLLARATADVKRPRSNLLWALLVAAGGGTLWTLGWRAGDAAGFGVSHGSGRIALFGGLAFVLVAALLARPWPVPAGALAVLLAAGVAAGIGLRDAAPDDLTERLQAAGLQREALYTVRVAGYTPTGDRAYGPETGGSEFLPTDPAAIPPLRIYHVRAEAAAAGHPRKCADSLENADSVDLLPGGVRSCAEEPGGLLYYTTWGNDQIYLRRRGAVLLVATATPGVERAALRTAIRAARPATAAERKRMGAAASASPYPAPAPGYRFTTFNPDSGTEYDPSGTIDGVAAVAVRLHLHYGGRDQICFGQTRCTDEAGGLVYFRSPDQHGYAIPGRTLTVQLSGGPAVNRDLLRDAIRTARPATDEELLRVLPRPAPRNRLDAIGRWLHDHT